MLQSKLPLEFSEAASEAEAVFHFFWSEVLPSDSYCAVCPGEFCSKAMSSASKQGPLMKMEKEDYPGKLKFKEKGRRKRIGDAVDKKNDKEIVNHPGWFQFNNR